jgi:hypothetical protein
MFKFFQSFLAKMKASFQRIARATKNEMSDEDLHGDALLAADEIGKRRGRDIDFSDPQDQQLILGALYIRNVKRPEKNIRYAVRTDASYTDEEGEHTGWADRLYVDEAPDPLDSLLLREAAIDPDVVLANSYSQAAGYIRVFGYFRGDRQRVCTHLAIADGTLARRVSHAADSVRVQPSMFDRIERIPVGFLPPAGRQFGAKIEETRDAKQWSWEFEEAF